MKIYLFILCLSSALFSQAQQSNIQKIDNEKTIAKMQEVNLYDYNVAYFASGCFWCVEAIYESLPGVVDAIAGYSGGHTDFVNYMLSNTANTGHAEAVAVYYDKNKISYNELLSVYFNSQDIEQKNGQGPDVGSQYRSILFYQTLQQKQIIEQSIAHLKRKGIKVAAEVKQFDHFFIAEDYHQDFKKRNPNHPYIKNVSDKRFKKFQQRQKEGK